LISGLSVCQADSKTIEVRWNTNQPTIGRVLFGTSSVPYLINNAFLGYQNATEKNASPSSNHVVLMNNLISGTQYFIRPTSAVYQNGSFESAGDELNVIVGGAKPCGTMAQEVTVSNPNTQTSCPFIKDYMRIYLNNDRSEVLKLQNFLKTREGYDVDETGIFDTKTDLAVKAFQNKYAYDILRPWGENSQATGYVYITTKNKINNIVCGNSILNSEEMNIVNDYYENQRTGGSINGPYSPNPSSDQNQASTTIIGNLDKGFKAGVSNLDFEGNNKNVATIYAVGSSTSDRTLDDKELQTFCAEDDTPGLLNRSILFLQKALFGGLQN
jgi:peptidoglycan hydrolase-like protein with peptidoglycan-binding domain